MRFAIPTLLAIVLLAGAQQARADALADGVAAMPGAVEVVRFAGNWTEGDTAGVYRVVLARSGSPIAARMFIQWVAVGSEGASVKHSVEIEEFAALKTDIVDFFAESDTDGLAVHIESINGDGYELFVSGPESHRFGRASN